MYNVKATVLRNKANVAQYSKLVNKAVSRAPTNLYRSCIGNGEFACGNQNRRVSFNSMEKAMGQYAADTYIESMNLNSKSVDTPLVTMGEGADVKSWEWLTGLENSPQHDMAKLKAAGKLAKDPFDLVEKDVSTLSGGIKDLLGSDHPVLESCAKYFFETDGGKKIRPSMVLAVAYALNAHQEVHRTPSPKATKSISACSSNTDGTSCGSNGSTTKRCGGYGRDVREIVADKENCHTDIAPVFPYLTHHSYSDTSAMYATPTQKRLAEIAEMIHTASLFHDDVIDKATTRRNMDSVNQVFGNKLAILGGDFLLSRASVSLARLRNYEVVELMSTVIEHLVKGEIMQMKPSSSGKSALEYYLRKNFYKTASLMGHSCLCAAVLGGYNEDCKRAAYLYGTYVGQAFQLIDDALDFEGTTSILGKAPLADLKSGLATAPTLFAAEEFPKLLTLIGRKFEGPGDVDEALSLVKQSQGLKKCKELAQIHAELAIEAISVLEPSPARDSLIALACKVVSRTY